MAVFLLLFSLAANGFTLTDQRGFAASKVFVDLAAGSCAGAGMSQDELFDLAMRAADKFWNRVATCALQLRRGERVRLDFSSVNLQSAPSLDGAFGSIRDNRIVVGCVSLAASFPDNSTLAAGLFAQNKGAVFINATATSRFQEQNPDTRLASVAHEMGHAFALGHSGDPNALMYYAAGAKVQKRLSMDDYDACSYLYPHDNALKSCAALPPATGGGSKGRGLVSLLLAAALSFLAFGPGRRRISR